MSNEAVDKTIHEHDGVVLLSDRPEDGLVAGDTGTVVHVYQNADAYEVEFPNPTGDPRFLVVTVTATNVLKLQSRTAGGRLST